MQLAATQTVFSTYRKYFTHHFGSFRSDFATETVEVLQIRLADTHPSKNIMFTYTDER